MAHSQSTKHWGDGRGERQIKLVFGGTRATVLWGGEDTNHLWVKACPPDTWLPARFNAFQKSFH